MASLEWCGRDLEVSEIHGFPTLEIPTVNILSDMTRGDLLSMEKVF